MPHNVHNAYKLHNPRFDYFQNISPMKPVIPDKFGQFHPIKKQSTRIFRET